MQKYLIKKMQDGIASFIHDQHHHIITVMRNKVGSQLIGLHAHEQYLCEIISLDPLRAKILNQIVVDVTNTFEMNVFQASIKPNAMDLAIIKACELNANNFFIFESAFSQKNIQHNLLRYQKLILNACQQCGRADLMQIIILNNMNDLMVQLNTNDINLIGHFTNHSTDLAQLILNKQKIGIVIGPEGGWTSNDFDYLKNEKNHIINLTKTILRAETAMIFLLSVISYIKLGE